MGKKGTGHAGHAKQGNSYSGASGYCKESVENRKINAAVFKWLRIAGYDMTDCTVDKGSSASDIIARIKAKINAVSNSTINYSVHLNSDSNAGVEASDEKNKGVECLVYSLNDKAAVQIADRICKNIAALGFRNRGVKPRTNLSVLKGIINGGENILIETFFCDDEDDYKLYQKVGADAIGKAIAEGIVGEKIVEGKAMAEVQLYEINRTDAQKWQVIHNGDGSVTLKNKACGLCLDVASGSAKTGAKLQAYKGNGSKAQKFKLQQSTGYTPSFVAPVELIPMVNTGLRVDCVSGGTANGTKIQNYTKNNSNAQKWQIVDNGDGTWTIINVKSMKALDVVGGGK